MATTQLRRALVGVALFGLSGIAGAAFAPPAHATGTTITVTTTADDNSVDGNCSLREAIDAADTDATVDACPAGSGADTIVLGAHAYTVGLDELEVHAPVTIQGASSTTTLIDYEPTGCASPAICTRAFFVHTGVQLAITGVTIEHAPTAIRNQGTLALSDSVINSENASCSSHPLDQATAIENHGTATLQGVTITRTADAIYNAPGATFTAGNLTMHYNGSCAEGQSVENLGTMALTNSTFDADIGGANYAASIDNESAGHLTVLRSRFLHNTGGQGTEVITNTGNATITDSAFDHNAIMPVLNVGRLAIHGTRFSTNAPLPSGSPTIQNWSAPATIQNWLGGALYMDSSTVDHNVGAVTGGIMNASFSRMTLANDTITDNVALYGPYSASGIGLPSGGITNDAVMMLRNVTIARNRVLGFRDWRYHAGGIVTMPHGYTALSNTIVSDNAADMPETSPDCFGNFHSLGYNLILHTADCFIGASTTGNVLGQSAHLRPLAPNGGPTMTALPPWDSPAVDTASPGTPDNDNQSHCAELDQRGVARPRDGNADGTSRCDIGAVER